MLLLCCLTPNSEHLANGLMTRHAESGASVQRLKGKQVQDKKMVLISLPLVLVYHSRGVPSASTAARYHQISVQATLTGRSRYSVFYFCVGQFSGKFHVKLLNRIVSVEVNRRRITQFLLIYSVYGSVVQNFPIDNKGFVQCEIQPV